MKPNLDAAISAFGLSAKRKLANPSVHGEPEDQLRAPFEELVPALAALVGLSPAAVAMVGESAVHELKTRPDYAVTVSKALVGFVELKAPGKGADPRKFRDPHDREQWERLRLLPNVLFSDGNEFGLWQNGEPVGAVVRLAGDIGSSGARLSAPRELVPMLESFLHWNPVSPRSAKELAHVSARLCRLLRDEVTEQLAAGSAALTGLATDWRKLLFPDATDARFADGYAQAVTFGMLMARAKGIRLSSGLGRVSEELGRTSSLIGAALRLLTDDSENQAALKTSLGTLTRVLDSVHWPTISKGNPDTWLYFYEDFLEVYDNALRKQTGSYYTPPEVVGTMVRLVDEVLSSSRFGLQGGMASSAVTLADPATGTGTFPLGVLRKIAETVAADEGAGAVPGAINAAVQRLIAFEMQLGPFAVAQLRLLAEIVDLTGAPPKHPPRMFVTNTLGNPDEDDSWIPALFAPLASSRRDANKIKREEPVTVVIGNPPYKEKARGRGGWVEGEIEQTTRAPLLDWIPPPAWGVSAHAKHLRNLYVYFWRWATWKVFDHHPKKNTGIVCFITVAGFLGGPGFQRMRDYLRRTCDDIWVIDCTPEGHQPEVSTRIFQGVQHPVCIVLASKSASSVADVPARVRFHALPLGRRSEKFAALGGLTLSGDSWTDCPEDWRSPFLPASTGAWASYPALEDLFSYNGSGVQPKRTWVIAPDAESLERRWDALIAAPPIQKEALFHATLRDGKPADRHVQSVVREALPGYEPTTLTLMDEQGPCPEPVRYGLRSFNRQWIIPDSRVITQPNAVLWEARSDQQVFLTAPSDRSPTTGPALTVSALVPDLHHYNGRGGRVFPLWRDREATVPNMSPSLLALLSTRLGVVVSAGDLVAYIVALTAHPGFATRFRADLSTPGLRVPLTADGGRFSEACRLGRSLVWLHTFGERMTDTEQGRPVGAPRLSLARRPSVPPQGRIPESSAEMPDSIAYDEKRKRLTVGSGYVERVEPAVWLYEVSGKQVLRVSADRERPFRSIVNSRFGDREHSFRSS